MKSIQNYIGIMLLAALWSCEDFYVPKIDELPKSLVVEAILSDQPGFFTVKLSRTAPFDGRSYFMAERKASVSLHTTEGDNYYFYEKASGNYQSNDSIFPKTGVGYYLYISTTDGHEYRSDTEVMLAPCSIENIQLEDSVYRELRHNYWGEPYVKDFEGVFISVQPSEPTNPDVGFLYQWNSLVNYHVLSAELPLEFNYYCWKKMSSSMLYVYDYYEGRSGNTLILDNLHFLSYTGLSPLPIDSSRFEGTIQSAYSRSFYYHLKQYTISSNGADFWRGVKRQSEANGKLFDPVEEELITNIYCVTDHSMRVYGFFNTASYSEKIIAVKIGYMKIDWIKQVDYFPVPNEFESCEEQPTTFWIK